MCSEEHNVLLVQYRYHINHMKNSLTQNYLECVDEFMNMNQYVQVYVHVVTEAGQVLLF